MITSTTKIRVRYAETDRMQFAHHTRYFEWFECARTELLREIGYSYKSVEDDGTFLPLVEANCKYIQPALYDDILEIHTSLKNLPRSTLKLDYQIIRSEDQILLAEAFTIHAMTNKNGRPIKPPIKFLNFIKENI